MLPDNKASCIVERFDSNSASCEWGRLSAHRKSITDGLGVCCRASKVPKSVSADIIIWSFLKACSKITESEAERNPMSLTCMVSKPAF